MHFFKAYHFVRNKRVLQFIKMGLANLLRPCQFHPHVDININNIVLIKEMQSLKVHKRHQQNLNRQTSGQTSAA